MRNSCVYTHRHIYKIINKKNTNLYKTILNLYFETRRFRRNSPFINRNCFKNLKKKKFVFAYVSKTTVKN